MLASWNLLPVVARFWLRCNATLPISFFRVEKRWQRFFSLPRLGLCGVRGSIALLRRWVPWYGQYSFAVIWNWIRGAGERGRDDEEYQSFCLSCEVICGSTESAIMKVHLFTTKGLWLNLLSPRRRTWKNGSKCSVEEVLSIQSWQLLTSVRAATAPALVGA